VEIHPIVARLVDAEIVRKMKAQAAGAAADKGQGNASHSPWREPRARRRRGHGRDRSHRPAPLRGYAGHRAHRQNRLVDVSQAAWPEVVGSSSGL